MHLSQYALSTAVLSTGVNAFYPYLRTSLDSALDRRFYPYQLGASIDDDTAGLPTLPLKKRSTPRRRENHYTVIEGNPPSTPNSVAVNDDGQDFSYFFAMEFGSKNQSMWMLFDTGGTNTWAFSNNCTVQACEMHNTFGSNDSTTLQVTTDPFDVGYGTGTVTGVLGADVVSFADFSMNLTFGLVSNASSDFEDYPMDGILGLGRSNSSTTGTLTAMETIAESHSLQSNIIGISLQRSSDGAKDGEITFGGVDDTKFTGNITYTDTSPGTTLWQIPLDDAVVNGEPLNFTGKSAIVDTGTSYIFLPPSDAAAIHTLIPGSAASGENFKIPCSSNVTVEFTISGISYSISPKDYVGSGADSTGTTCYSNIIGVQTAGTDNWLLGDVFLKNVYTVFDFDQNRVGFAARNGTVATTTTASAAASTDATSAAATSAGSPTGTSAATSQSPVQTGSAASFAHPKAALLAGAMSLYTLIYV